MAAEITLVGVAQRFALICDEMPIGPALESELDRLIRDVRQAAMAGPPSPLVASKLGEFLLLQPAPSAAALDEAESWFKRSLAGVTGSQDWVPGWLGLARVELHRARLAHDPDRVEHARERLLAADKAITTIQNFTIGPGVAPTAPTSDGITPTQAYVLLVAELRKNEAVPSEFIAGSSAMQQATRTASIEIVQRLRARRALVEGECTLAGAECRGEGATATTVLAAFDRALAYDQNLVDVRVCLLRGLLAIARDGSRVDVGAAINAQAQARSLLTFESAGGMTPDADLLRQLLTANNLILASYLGRTLTPTEFRDRDLVVESSAQAVAIAKNAYPSDGELLALIASHLAMVSMTGGSQVDLAKAMSSLAKSKSGASGSTGPTAHAFADAENLCRLAIDHAGVAP